MHVGAGLPASLLRNHLLMLPLHRKLRLAFHPLVLLIPPLRERRLDRLLDLLDRFPRFCHPMAHWPEACDQFLGLENRLLMTMPMQSI